MAYYYPEYEKARAQVEKMRLEELLSYLDSLFGRDKLKYGDGIEEVRAEALHQCALEFTDTSSQAYREREYWRKVGKGI